MIKTIKRPLAVIGFSFFISIALALSLPREWNIILLAVFALFTFIHNKIKKTNKNLLLLIFISTVLAVIYVNIYSLFYYKDIQNISTEERKYTGYISKILNFEESSFVCTLLDVNGNEAFDVNLYGNNELKLGDVVEVIGNFVPAKQNKYIYSNYAQNTKGSLNAKNIEIINKNIKTVNYNALKVRSYLLESISEIYDNDVVAVVSAMGYNDKHMLSTSINELFAKNGLSHTLVVSGFHISIIATAVQIMLSKIFISKKIKNIIIAFLIMAFMFVAGMTASMIRAGFISITVLLCKNFNKEPDYLTTLAFIGFICTLSNPFISRDIGAMLSYSASAGIIVSNEWCIKRKIEGCKSSILCCTAAVMFTMPVLVLAKMKITLLSPIINLLFAPFVFFICVLSVITPILNIFPVLNILNAVFVPINKWLILSMLNLLEFGSEYLNFAFINLSDRKFLFLFASIIFTYFLSYFCFDKKETKKIFVIAVSILAFICYNLLNYNTAIITVFDSGRECSFHISAYGKEYLVLSENISVKKAKSMLLSVNKSQYNTVYCCFKNFDVNLDISDISKNILEIKSTGEFCEEGFKLKSVIEDNRKLFILSAAKCDIAFGHGKVYAPQTEYYFLGNDKPKNVKADEIYIFGKIPKWMTIENINSIDSDLTIKINLKTGRYKTVKDVFNFGNWI